VVLSAVKYSQVVRVESKRKQLWGKMQGQLNKPDSTEDDLTLAERKELQQMIEFTHPSKYQLSDFFNMRTSTKTNATEGSTDLLERMAGF